MKAKLLLVTFFALPSAFARNNDPQKYLTHQRAPFEITAEDSIPKRVDERNQYKTTPNRRAEDDRASGLADKFLKTDADREQYRVIIKGCIAASMDGRIATSTNQKNDDTIEYVMDVHGNFYLFDESGWPSVRHSSILNGGGIAGGGEIKLDRNGKITYFDNKSGHYGKNNLKPLMPQVLGELIKAGCKEDELTKGY